MVHGIPMKVPSTVPLPKDPGYFKRERKQAINRMLTVGEAKPVIVQADALKEEMYNCLKPEYSSESLPLLLHEYFVNRMEELVQAKYLHLLRWKRFCEHTSAIESLYPYYQKRICQINAEYRDCLERAQRLAVAKEALSQNTDIAAQSVKREDLIIYLRWLICQHHAVKKVNQYLTVLQWFHVSHKNHVMPVKETKEEDVGQKAMNNFSIRYDDVETSMLAANKTASKTALVPSLKNSQQTKVSGVPNPPPLVNPQLFSTNPVPPSSFLMAAAAAGGGLAAGDSGSLPLHCNEFQSLKPHILFLAHLYDVESNVEEISSTADEMEMYAAVLRVFKRAFTRQEAMKTFKTYDCLEMGSQNWGADHSTHALKKDCNWLQYIAFKLDTDPIQEKEMTRLRHDNNIDQLLETQSRFLQINDPEKVLDVLKAHATAVKAAPSTQEISVRNNRTKHNPLNVLLKIYANPDQYSSKDRAEEGGQGSFDPKDVETVKLGPSKTKKRKESYDYADTVQMLGLEEGGGKDEQTSSIQGGYLSYLYLRHLRIRDLQRTCLSVLNYFRSLERTLTINVNGLAHENGNLRVATPLGHKTNNASENIPTPGLNSHAYMHNTPADYRIAAGEFMEFTEVDNHDDFYTTDEGRVHVQDQRGYYVMYESALKDLQELEADLLLVSSYYIQKDRKQRTRSGAAGGLDMPSLSHNEVDRLAILLDIWTNEACFLENKKLLLDCYMESYQHVLDKEERAELAQIMYSIMHQRPRFDFSADYFLKTYRLESVILRLQAGLVKGVLDNQIEECRQYVQKVCRDVEGSSEVVFGLPFPVIPHQPISLNMSMSALKNVYMLEFHPSLSLAARIPAALSHAYWELHHIHKPNTVTNMLDMEMKIIEQAITSWESLPAAGSSFASQVQKELFSGVFIEDPSYLCEVALALVDQQEQQDQRKTKKLRQAQSVATVGKVMELITLRHRMLEAAWETEVLSTLYKKLAVEMGFDECHLYMRFLQFDYAVYKENAGKPPPKHITSIQDDESAVDRLVPKDMPLAIHELDENGLGRFTFRSREGVMNLLKPSGLDNFRTILLSQVNHKNALLAAVQQAHVCGVHMKTNGESFNMEGTGRMSPADTKSEKSSFTALTGFSAGTKGEVTVANKTLRDRSLRSPEAFVSLQLEKSTFRDLMLNEFLEKKRTMAVILKNPEEFDKLKRQLIMSFNQRYSERVHQYSLRGQIVNHYNGILGLLLQFPNIRDTYFMLGEPNEKKNDSDSPNSIEPDPRKPKKRPKRVMSDNGESLLNLWFIPHHSELLLLFKHLPQTECLHALHNLCRITAALHDMMQYLCAHSKLGSAQALLGSQKVEFVSADWGGTEGIGAELREVQKQIDNLINPTDPGTVAKFLQLRRDVMFLTMDTAVRHSMRDTFLASNNSHAFQAVSKSLHFALPRMSSEVRKGLHSSGMPVPDPLESYDAQARAVYPWRSFVNRNGPYPTMLWQSHRIEHNLQTCLCGLRDVDRHVANGEILGVSLLLEDILQSGNQDSSTFVALAITLDDEGKPKKTGGSRPTSSYSMVSAGRSTQKTKPSSISRTRQPIEAYQLLKHFLLLWKCTEVFKQDWSLRRLQVEKVDTPALYRLMSKEYKEQKLFPVLQSLARRTGNSDMYEGITHDTEPLIMPPNVSEIEVKAAQLLKLIESLEEHMIQETMKKLTKDLNLAFAERGREETALPTDLWKRPSWKENFTIARPEIAENFAAEIWKDATETEESITISKQSWETAIKGLTSDILAREKFDYESYTSYYEALLKVNTQLLYTKEQEIKYVKDQLQRIENNIDVEVQCRLADRNHELIMEVTALRAQLTEMRNNALVQETVIRERQRDEYNELVQNLYQACFSLRQKLDEHREEIYEDVCKKVSETLIETDQNIANKLFKDKDKESKEQKRANEEELKLRIKKEQLTSDLRTETFELRKTIYRMKSMSTWKLNHVQSYLRTKLHEKEETSENNRKQSVKMQMLAEQEIVLLRQQILALRRALGDSEKEAGEMRKKLDKEMKTRKEKLYAAMQQAANQRQLELAKAANVEKLLEELEEKELQMQRLAYEQEKDQRLHQLTQEKTKKDVNLIKKQLNHERNLKLGAFHRVDELQAKVYDQSGYDPHGVRAHTVMGMITPGAPPSSMPSRAVSVRALSAAPCRTRTYSQATEASNNSALQRPKSTNGRLARHKIAEQLLNDLERGNAETFETVQKLQPSKGAAFMTTP
ncbi:uncharacterized protein [Watersipora subatra]|uniref:uncharacterized protein n=1 Tax=Watersipora subatra TaxID=2589382 RepID=UPI00355C2D49